jgi:Bacteriophage Lambda NinG protein
MARLSNSTIRVNKEHLKCGCYDYNFSRGRCRKHAIIDNIRTADKLVAMQYEDLSGLIDDADAVVSKYIRLSAADEYGSVKCFTCDEVYFWADMDAGHYITRSCMYLRFDQRNIKPQCHTCNRVKRGMPAVYSLRLEELFPGLVEELIRDSRMVYNIPRDELRTIISDTTQKLSKIKIPIRQ